MKPYWVNIIACLLISPWMCNSQSLVELCSGRLKCVVGSVCGPLINKECTDNAICDKSTCQCRHPFISTSYGFCLPGFGADCSEFPCNEESFLLCDSNKKCSCPLLNTHWSSIQNQCVAAADSSCSEALTCTDNAYCNFMYDWMCHCEGGYSKTSTGHCLRAHGFACNIQPFTSTCNADDFLVCGADNICDCEDGRIWMNNKCLGKAGAICDLNVISNNDDAMSATSISANTSFPECISNAECIRSDPFLLKQGRCQCREEFQGLGDLCASGTSTITPISFVGATGVILMLLSMLFQ